MKRIVVKFGGTSVMDTERIKRVADIVADVYSQGYEVLVVVSAMGHTTDHLLDLAGALAPCPESREVDMLLSTGEQAAAALVAIALQERGIKAQSFTGALAGIVTDRRHGQAKIKHVHCQALENCLDSDIVPVVAGFQGVSDNGQVTTLGRGGSDTTAIALAASLHAERCDIYSDVDGVYSADPRLLPSSYKLSTIAYKEMLELARNGAQILNARSVEIAMRRNVAVRVRSTFKPEDEGTLVLAETRKAGKFTGIACSLTQDYVRIVFNVPGINKTSNVREMRVKRLVWKKTILSLLSEAGIHVEVGSPLKANAGELYFCVEKCDLEAALEIFNKASHEGRETIKEINVHSDLAKVSIVASEVCSYMEVDAIVALTKAGIHISLITSAELRLSLFVAKEKRDLAVSILHSKFAGVQVAA
jgi:aspartate kinase